MDKVKPLFLNASYIVALLLALASLLLFFAVLFGDGESNGPALTFLVLTLIFGGLTVFLKRKLNHRKAEAIESIALNMAAKDGGFVTAAELAMKTSLTMDEATQYLDDCCSRDVCEKRFTEEHLVEVYRFKSVISVEQKQAAKGIEELVQ